MAEAFIPPAFNLPVAWMIDFSMPLLLKQVQNIDRVVFRPEDAKLLRSLKNERLIYASNHPSTAEPPIAYCAAMRMGSRFHYMAARQVFDWGYGFVGRFIQSIGAFSVIPGVADRESLKASRAILASPAGKLCLFPEGEPTSGENDSLMPFQPGIAQLGFWSLEDARKTEPNADVKILPAFVKYIIKGTDASIKVELHTALRVIETELEIDPGNRNLLRRFLFIGRILLERAEREYRVPAGSAADYDYRIGRIRHAILDQVQERFNFAHWDPKADAIQKLRFLLAQLEIIEVGIAEAERLPRLTKVELEWAKQECMRAYSFISARPEYIIARPTAERFFEWLVRYENAVLGKSKQRARDAHVFYGPVTSLGAIYDDYKKNKRKVVDQVTRELRESMDVLLTRSLELSQPIVRPGDVGDEI